MTTGRINQVAIPFQCSARWGRTPSRRCFHPTHPPTDRPAESRETSRENRNRHPFSPSPNTRYPKFPTPPGSPEAKKRPSRGVPPGAAGTANPPFPPMVLPILASELNPPQVPGFRNMFIPSMVMSASASPSPRPAPPSHTTRKWLPPLLSSRGQV